MPINYCDYPVLVIDDEEDFLAIFRHLGGRFELDTERYPSVALDLVRRKNYCVIISDNKMRNSVHMPEDEQAGVTLLRRVKAINDHPLRVLVTGWSKEGICPSLSSHADINMLIDKLDVVTPKEWDDALRGIIRAHLKSHCVP